jgi:hypothetical protein
MLVLPVIAHADDTHKPLARSQSVEARATVTAVDPATRVVTLKTEGSELIDVVCGPEIKNFDQIKVGDVVKAKYTESVAFRIVPKGEAAGGVDQTVERIPGGAEVSDHVTTTFKVASVDPKTNILWVTLPNGSTKQIHVQDPEAQGHLKHLSPGNVVAVTYTESAAVQLEKLAGGS